VFPAHAPEHPPNPAPPRAAEPPPPQPETLDGVASDVYLRATRLALDGCGRGEIAARLRIEFGIADPEPVLNRVLGPA
jgi:hypothetical protein